MPVPAVAALRGGRRAWCRRARVSAIVEIAISSRGAEPSEALASATRLKIGRLAKFLDGLELARVHFGEEKNPRIVEKAICEVVIEGRGQQVQCKVSASDSFAALDVAVEKLEHQLAQLKSRSELKNQRG
jgi:ribosomal subunit interface protein